jgi:hypothetical protein
MEAFLLVNFFYSAFTTEMSLSCVQQQSDEGNLADIEPD